MNKLDPTPSVDADYPPAREMAVPTLTGREWAMTVLALEARADLFAGLGDPDLADEYREVARICRAGQR